MKSFGCRALIFDEIDVEYGVLIGWAVYVHEYICSGMVYGKRKYLQRFRRIAKLHFCHNHKQTAGLNHCSRGLNSASSKRVCSSWDVWTHECVTRSNGRVNLNKNISMNYRNIQVSKKSFQKKLTLPDTLKSNQAFRGSQSLP